MADSEKTDMDAEANSSSFWTRLLQPLRNQPVLLRAPDAYIAAVNIARFIGDGERVLLVGDAGGRDYQYLQKLGKEVHVVDVAEQSNIPNIVCQSIEDRTPYQDGYFDAVVMAEVLEHLVRDFEALQEVRRILKDDGTLVITVPYMSNVQDEAEFHVRVQTDKTIRRLLHYSGFCIEEHFYRGFCSLLPNRWLTSNPIFISQKLAELAFGLTPERAVERVNDVFDRLERYIGMHPRFSKFQSWFVAYGGVMRVVKCEPKDNHAIQRKYFEG